MVDSGFLYSQSGWIIVSLLHYRSSESKNGLTVGLEVIFLVFPIIINQMVVYDEIKGEDKPH